MTNKQIDQKIEKLIRDYKLKQRIKYSQAIIQTHRSLFAKAYNYENSLKK